MDAVKHAAAAALLAMVAFAGEIYVPGDALRGMKAEDLCRQACESYMKLWKGPCDEATFATYSEKSCAAFGLGTDEEISSFVPSVISPRARIKDVPYPEIRPWLHWTGHFTRDQHDSYYALQDFKGVCPFCDDHGSSILFDKDDPCHATTRCCRRDLWHSRRAPADYDLKTNSVARFRYLDDSLRDIPCTLYRDGKGRTWELFLDNIFNNRDWTKANSLVGICRAKFISTGDPIFAYKAAVLMDRITEVYYSLPLVLNNLNIAGRDGLGLTRAEWENFPGRPNIWAKMPKEGWWNRGIPSNGRGWAIEGGEGGSAYGFAILRHHPAFKYYSKMKYGSENSLNDIVCRKFCREVAMNYTSISMTGLVQNYQAASTQNMLVNALLGGDSDLFEFAAPCYDAVIYNHHYADGLNGEGSPGYQSMLLSFYAIARDDKGYLTIDTGFKDRNPFIETALESFRAQVTARGKLFEQGDYHYYLHDYDNDPHYGRNLDTNDVPRLADMPSRLWPSWGEAVLRGGDAKHRLEIILHFSRPTAHGAAPLSLACWFDGLPCIRPHGYAAPWGYLEKPAVEELNRLGFPRRVLLCEDEKGTDVHHRWIRTLVKSPIGNNSMSIDGLRPLRHGLTEPVCYKGTGVMHVVEARATRDFREFGNANITSRGRAIAMVTTPGGRAYALDFTTFQGGTTQTVWYSVWGERAGSQGLENVAPQGSLLDVDFGGKRPARPKWMNYGDWLTLYNWMPHVVKVEPRGSQDKPWHVDYDVDYYAYYRDGNGQEYGRPRPGFGKTAFRIAGAPAPKSPPYAVYRAKTPFSALLCQQKRPGGKGTFGTETATFEDGYDVVGLRRSAQGNARDTVMAALLEGRRTGEEPVVKSLSARSSGRARIITLWLSEGGVDMVVYNPDNRRISEGGLVTDARFAFVRRAADGTVVRREMVEGTYLSAQDGSSLSSPSIADVGTVVRIEGDITGDAGKSVIFVKPDAPWADDDLSGRFMTWRLTRAAGGFENDEGFIVESAERSVDGLVRISLKGPAPFIMSWHQLFRLDDGNWAVNRELRKQEHAPYYAGLRITFPRKGNKTFTLKEPGFTVGTQFPCSTISTVEDMSAAGIEPGDWFYVWGLAPGQKVRLSRMAAK